MAAGLNRSPIKNHAYRMAATPAIYSAAATVQAYVSLATYHRAVALPLVGALDGDVTVTVMEATSAAGAGAQALTDPAVQTFENGTDENRLGIIEVNQGDLSEGYDHVALRVVGDATNFFAALWELLDPVEAPITNAETDSVAWAVASTD